jgi:PEP-CTERM putative exosortase interaction domain
MLPRSFRYTSLTPALLAAISTLSAQTINWDGNGDANASGDWLDDVNWAGDAAPSATSITAGLGNVSSGTRIITINTGETATAKNLAFTQTSADGTNILSIASGGTLNLGGGQIWDAPTAGTSRVELGGTIDFTGLTSGSVTVNTGLSFTANGAVFRSSNASGAPVFNFNGSVDVNVGSGGLAQIAYTGGNRAITTNFGATSHLSISSGTLEIATPLYNNTPGVTISLQGTTAIAAGAGLKLTPDSASNGGGGSSGVSFSNSGALTIAGKITTGGRGGGGATTFTNSGTWHVSGLDAVIEKATRAATGANPTFTNTTTGVFAGASADDRIVFNHDQIPGTDLAFTNSGVIAAGNGSGGDGLSSVGTLTLVNFAVVNTDTSTLVFDVGGVSTGQFDVLALESGTFDFGDATISINLVNDFVPTTGFALDIFVTDAPASVSGTIAGLLVNGVANDDFSFSYDASTGIGTLSFTGSAIPEPSSAAALLGAAGLGLAALRRRRSR